MAPECYEHSRAGQLKRVTRLTQHDFAVFYLYHRGHMDAHDKLQLLERYFKRPLTQHEKLLGTLGEISCGVLGAIKNDRPEFILVPLGPDGGLSEGDRLKARLNDYWCAGLFSYADGYADASVEPDSESWRILVAATPAFFAYLAERLAPKSDAVSWLEKLHSLKDERTAN